MDKSAFKMQSFEEAADHQRHYMNLKDEDKKDLFFTLMQAPFGFVGNDWPKMDKSHFEARCLIQNEEGTEKNKNLDDLDSLEVKST